MTKRPEFAQRKFRAVNAEVISGVIALLRNLPIDPIKPLEILVREEVKGRKLDQNALMWVGPLKCMAEQCYLEGRAHSAEVWHEFMKREFLPEEFDAALCKDGYEKWSIGPTGERYLIGSTTQLTVKGMAQYIEQLHAFGSNLGVRFTESPNNNNF